MTADDPQSAPPGACLKDYLRALLGLRSFSAPRQAQSVRHSAACAHYASGSRKLISLLLRCQGVVPLSLQSPSFSCIPQACSTWAMVHSCGVLSSRILTKTGA